MPKDRDPTPSPATPAPTLLVGRYRLGEMLGRGAHGEVHLAEDYGRGGELVALKQVEGRADAGEWQEEAARALRWFRHPNWADVLDAGFIREGAWFQSLRYVKGKSLEEVGGPVASDLVWRFLEDGARVLQALHRCGLIHYDVTPGNFILEEAEEGPRFILTDGGLAHLGPVTGASRGTPLYLAPELMDDQPHDARVDFYALGLVAFRLATGQEPFGTEEGASLALRKRQSAPRARSINPKIPEALDDLIAKLLNRRADRRPSDGRAILRLIAKGTGKSMPEMTKAEAYAAADGGCLVGRTPALKRFDHSRLQLSSALAVLRAKANGFSITGIEEPVLLLCGSSGSGCTRLSRQMVHEAQAAEIPVLLIAGRDGAPNPQAPLDLLFEGLQALGRERGPTLEPGERPRRGRRTRRERAYSKQRTVEHFLRLAHAAARRTPYLLAVEDFADLPELAQAAVRALARDLLSRAEHGPDRAAPPVLLLIDLGAGDLQPFLIPDSETPRRPVVPVPPITRDKVNDLCARSFPGLALREADLEILHKATEGLPGALVAMLGEAAYRGDLGPDEEGWVWDLTSLDSYEVSTRLPLHLSDAIRRADAPLRALLSYLALAEAPLDEAVVLDLWSNHTESPFPNTPLVNTRRDGDRTLYALSNGAIRRTAIERLDANLATKAVRLRELHAALERHPHVDSALDRVRLLLETGDPRAAIDLLATTWESFGAERRFSAQTYIRKALDLDTALVADSAIRTAIAGLLERGPDAVEVATRLADAFPAHGEDIGAILEVAEVLEDAKDLDAALRLLDRHQDDPKAPLADRVLLNVRRAKLALDLRRVELGRETFSAARRDYKILSASAITPDALTAEYMVARARVRFPEEGSAGRIQLLLRKAEKAATRARTRLLRAQISNNLGIAMARTGALDLARKHFRRSLRLKKTLGDLKGEASTMLNLARVNLRSGQVLNATKNCIDCVHRAQRYGLFDTQIRALRLLADAYDRQHRPTLALDTLLRAWRMVRLNAASDVAGRVAWDLAPLAAVVGRLEVVATTLRATAALARGCRPLERERGRHYLSSAVASLHQGQHHRFRQNLRRASRYADKFTPEDRWMLGILAALAQPEGEIPGGDLSRGARHHQTLPMRHLYRVHIWYRRALRSGHVPPVPGLSGVRGGGARGIPAGSLGRIAAEFLLSAASRDASLLDDEALAQVQTYAGLSDAGLLQARALAVRSTHRVSPGEWKQSQHFSQAVALLDKIMRSTPQAGLRLPDEIRNAAGQLAENLGVGLDPDVRLRDLHALAHQALVRPGRSGRRTSPSGLLPHERLAVALRHVLEASARMRGANGVRELIASITKHTIDITGAQRACVVLRETDSDMEIWESSSVWDADGPVALRDVSNTVIQRVLESQTPVFRPYVIEDESLLQSSESIKNLGLLSVLCVPLRRRGALYGVLYADSTAVGAFEPVDVEVLSLFADQAAAAIETSRLVEDVQRSFAELKAMQDRLVRGERLRVIGELSSGVAHEFNNLLTAILARIQMMGLNYLPPEARRDLELIEKAALDAAAVVRRLQSFSRSQRQADFTMVDVGEVCRDAVDLLRPLWRKRGRHGRGPINVHLRTEPGLVARGDPTELREVVTNVLKNAIDSLRDGGRVTVSARRQRGRIHLRIRDDGSGIPAEILAKVFDPFYTTKGERGTGLGLSLSQQIVEQHGGSITIDSKEGAGTTVSVQLPAAEAGSAKPPADAEDEEAPRDALRVVVVDDDRDVLKSLCTYLERSGYEVISASNGSDGLEKTMEHEPDVVLTDVSMPGMDGIELCRRLHEARPHLPIVLMSGWASDLNHASAREAGAREVLSKPFEMPEVTRLLSTVAEPKKK